MLPLRRTETSQAQLTPAQTHLRLFEEFLCLCGDYAKSVMESTSSWPCFILWNFAGIVWRLLPNLQLWSNLQFNNRLSLLSRLSAVLLCFLVGSGLKKNKPKRDPQDALMMEVGARSMVHLISSEVQQLSLLRQRLFVSQNAVVTFWDASSLNSLCCLVFWVFFGAAAQGKSISTCIFPCLVRVNRHAAAWPQNRCCQVGNYRSKLRKCISHIDLRPDSVKKTPPHLHKCDTGK